MTTKMYTFENALVLDSPLAKTERDEGNCKTSANPMFIKHWKNQVDMYTKLLLFKIFLRLQLAQIPRLIFHNALTKWPSAPFTFPTNAIWFPTKFLHKVCFQYIISQGTIVSPKKNNCYWKLKTILLQTFVGKQIALWVTTAIWRIYISKVGWVCDYIC